MNQPYVFVKNNLKCLTLTSGYKNVFHHDKHKENHRAPRNQLCNQFCHFSYPFDDMRYFIVQTTTSVVKS